MENLNPEQLLEFKVFLSDKKQRLHVVAALLIEDSVSDHLLEYALLVWTGRLEKELVAFRVRHDIVKEHTDLVTEAFVVLLVAMPQNHFKRSNKRRHNFRVNGQALDGFFAADLDQVPKGFD